LQQQQQQLLQWQQQQQQLLEGFIVCSKGNLLLAWVK
jgi:hypothetical protein